MRGHTKSLDANDKLIQTRSHVRNAIASRERQVVMRKVKSTIRWIRCCFLDITLKDACLFRVVSNKSANLEKVVLTACIRNVSIFLWRSFRKASVSNRVVSLAYSFLHFWYDLVEGMIQNIGQWSLTSHMQIPECVVILNSLVYRWSNKVELWSVILVGLFIRQWIP